MIGPAPEVGGLTVGELVALATFVVTVIVQSFGAYQYLAAQFRKRDEALQTLREEIGRRQEATQAQFTRQDRELIEMRGDLKVSLATIPAIDARLERMEATFDSRLERMEAGIDRLSSRMPSRGSYRDDGN